MRTSSDKLKLPRLEIGPYYRTAARDFFVTGGHLLWRLWSDSWWVLAPSIHWDSCAKNGWLSVTFRKAWGYVANGKTRMTAKVVDALVGNKSPLPTVDGDGGLVPKDAWCLVHRARELGVGFGAGISHHLSLMSFWWWRAVIGAEFRQESGPQ